MNILPACVRCGNTFTLNPRLPKQKYCAVCIKQSQICIDCGVKKHRSFRGPRCKKCDTLNRIDKPNLKNRRPEKPIEQVIVEAEEFGLVPEKQYAFGYVMGVVFGDGCVSKVSNRQSHVRSDGTQSVKRTGTYLIRLSVTSQAFAERFASQWEVLTGRPATISTKVRTNFSKSTLKGRSEGYSVQLFDVNPAHMLLGRYFKHLKHESELYELLRFPIEVMRGFVHGMIDSEGYINPKFPGRIDIANKRITLLDVIVLMLESLGCSGTVYTSSSQTVAHLVTRMAYRKYNNNT